MEKKKNLPKNGHVLSTPPKKKLSDQKTEFDRYFSTKPQTLRHVYIQLFFFLQDWDKFKVAKQSAYKSNSGEKPLAVPKKSNTNILDTILITQVVD